VYLMEPLGVPTWPPVVDQLQQGSATSLSSSTAASEDVIVTPGHSRLSACSPNSAARLAVVHASLQSSFTAALSDDSKVVPPPTDGRAAEALQERISRLISENASIINTPMAEAPRAKRVLRQSSDSTASSAAKPSAGRALLRTRSLTPCPTLPVIGGQHDAHVGSAGSTGALAPEDYGRKFLQRASSETASLAGKQFLTVPREPHSIEGLPAAGVMALSSQTEEDHVETDMQCSEVRIVLELADLSTPVTSAELQKAASVPALPAALSREITRQSLSAAASTAERQNFRLLSVPAAASSAMPGGFRAIKPAERPTCVPGSGGLAVQYVPAEPVTPQQTVVTPPTPLQCLLLGDVAMTSRCQEQPQSHRVHSRDPPPHSRSTGGGPVVVELVHAQPPPRRGRPRGSRNRPKPAAASSEPPPPRAGSAGEPLLVTSATTSSSSDSLWRRKLKDQLLRRSLSAERRSSSPASRQGDAGQQVPAAAARQGAVSQARTANQSHASAAPAVGRSGSDAARTSGAQLLSTSSLETASVAATVLTAAPPVAVRSRSCDASVPPKKRRKTLTELGRGTAFGTRVDELPADQSLSSVAPADQSQLSTAPADQSQSSNTPADDSAAADDAVFEPSPPDVVDTGAAGAFPLTNRALQIMYNSPPRASSSAATQQHGSSRSDAVDSATRPPQRRFIRLPVGVGARIPGLVRCTGSDPSLPVPPGRDSTVHNAAATTVSPSASVNPRSHSSSLDNSRSSGNGAATIVRDCLDVDGVLVSSSDASNRLAECVMTAASSSGSVASTARSSTRPSWSVDDVATTLRGGFDGGRDVDGVLVSSSDESVSRECVVAAAGSGNVSTTACGSSTGRSWSTDEMALFELAYGADPAAASSLGGTLLLLGHSYPSLGIVAEPTFCSVLGAQPACAETCPESVDERYAVSRHAAAAAPPSSAAVSDAAAAAPRETFSLYRTPRLGEDLSYAAAPGPASRSRCGGVLTHSSYWKFRTDSAAGPGTAAAADTRDGEEALTGSGHHPPAAADAAGRLDPSPTQSTDGSTSPPRVTAEDHRVCSPAMRAAAEVVASDNASHRLHQHQQQQRVLIFPGGYRSSESYVYVRGRGRGR